MINVLLTGAFGSVGYTTIKKLLAVGKYQITALDLKNRKNIARYNKIKDKISVIWGSITDSSIVQKAVKGKDYIIHLAAIIPPAADRNQNVTRSINLEGTKNVANAIKEENNEAFLVYSSSIAVYGDRMDNPNIRVTDKVNPGDDYYAQTKVEAEQYIQNLNIHHTIFRFTAIMGRPAPDPLMFHMPLDTKMEIASVDDTANALVKAYDYKEKLDGKIFNLSGGEGCRTTYGGFLQEMLPRYGINLKVLNRNAFATGNFHCGFLEDGDDLENIIHFRNDTLKTYFEKVDQSIDPATKFFSKIFGTAYFKSVQNKSEPLDAKNSNNQTLIRKFFPKKDNEKN